MQVNEKLVQDKAEKKQFLVNNKKADLMNFFPFTHGDSIEQQRLVLKDQTVQYLNELAKEQREKED